MGVAYLHLGKYDVRMFEKSFQIKLSALDNKDLSINNTYTNMGIVYRHQGNYDDAVRMLEKSLKIKLSVLGDNHPRNANTYQDVALVYCD